VHPWKVHGYGQIKIAATKKNLKNTPPRSAKRVGRRLRKPDGQVKRRQRQGRTGTNDGRDLAT
jgi:hypothetical protein